MRAMVAGALGALLLASSLALTPAPARAQEPAFLAFSLGAFDFKEDKKAAEFRLEYRSDLRLWVFTPFIGFMANNNGGTFGYGGFGFDIFFGRRIVVFPNAAVGGYTRRGSKNLGSTAEFRTGVEVSYRLDDRSRIGIAFNHISNAGISDRNPGVNSLVITYAARFDRLF